MTLSVNRKKRSVWASKNPVLRNDEPGFVRETNQFKIGDGQTAWNDLSFAPNNPNPRTYDDVVVLTSVSGAVTLDLSAGSVFVLNLTGNITSLAFSNPKGTGQAIEVHFAQDATGSRTLAGSNASIKYAGGAPTLTTTASKTDVFRFRQLDTVYRETSRALNS